MKNVFIVGIDNLDDIYDTTCIYINALLDNVKDCNYYILNKEEIIDERYVSVSKQHNNIYRDIYDYVVNNKLDNCYVYVFGNVYLLKFNKYYKLLKGLGCKFINHAFKEKKSNNLFDITICNHPSLNKDEYKYIPYGINSKINDIPIELPKDYYLVYGIENIELIIKEYLKADIDKKLVILSNFKDTQKYYVLDNKYNIIDNENIYIYDLKDYKLLPTIANHAYGFISTNMCNELCPYVLDIVANCKLNILINNQFNQAIGLNSCIYFDDANNSLKDILEHVENFSQSYINELGEEVNHRIQESFKLEEFVSSYQQL